MNVNNLSVDLLKIEKKENASFRNPDWYFEPFFKQNDWAYFNSFLSKEECDYIIEYATENIKSEKAKVSGDSEVNEHTRKTDISWIYPCEEMTWLYQRLVAGISELNKNYFAYDLVGFKEPLQFSKYSEGYGHYNQHMDIIQGNKYVRKLSFAINLVDGSEYDGGDLELHLGGPPDALPRDRGMLRVFPSYTLHAVTPVTKGCRYTLVGWVQGENFK